MEKSEKLVDWDIDEINLIVQQAKEKVGDILERES